jgi:hypothetical protein
MIDTSTGYDDDQDRLDRADEQIREQRWAEFVADSKRELKVRGLASMLRNVGLTIVHGSVLNFDVSCSGFAETEGWDGVLCAIARAYREEQDTQKKF